MASVVFISSREKSGKFATFVKSHFQPETTMKKYLLLLLAACLSLPAPAAEEARPLKLISYNFKLSPSETGSFAVIYLLLPVYSQQQSV